MPSISSPTNTDAVQGLVQRQNQVILDGTVAAVLADGELVISAQGAPPMLCAAVIDHPFAVGEPVILAKTNEGQFIVIGVGTTRTLGGAQPAPTRGPLTIASQSLHEAVLRLVDKQNQVLGRGSIVGVLAEGTLVVQLTTGPVLSRATTDQPFAVGQTIYAIKDDAGAYRVLGSP